MILAAPGRLLTETMPLADLEKIVCQSAGIMRCSPVTFDGPNDISISFPLSPSDPLVAIKLVGPSRVIGAQKKH